MKESMRVYDFQDKSSRSCQRERGNGKDIYMKSGRADGSFGTGFGILRFGARSRMDMMMMMKVVIVVVGTDK
jgi:hypothetical protein